MKTPDEMESMPRANRTGEVQAVTLQDVFSIISASTIILKMDIEGYECKVGGLAGPPSLACRPSSHRCCWVRGGRCL